jgi:hypothetical protein
VDQASSDHGREHVAPVELGVTDVKGQRRGHVSEGTRSKSRRGSG